MWKLVKLAGSATVALGLAGAMNSVLAQEVKVISFDPLAGPVCMGPFGLAPCAAIQNRLRHNASQSMPMPRLNCFPQDILKHGSRGGQQSEVKKILRSFGL